MLGNGPNVLGNGPNVLGNGLNVLGNGPHVLGNENVGYEKCRIMKMTVKKFPFFR